MSNTDQNDIIPFNKPHTTGKELDMLAQVVEGGKLSGDGVFTRKCQQFLEQRYGFSKCLLTTSCTDALELSAILLNIGPGDEVIVPSYTFVSSANAFALRGAKVVFADSEENSPNISASELERLITDKTKAIVLVHYAGFACDMHQIMSIADTKGIKVIEDAALAIDATYQGKPLGSFGALAAFSFHETKNIISGEGGALVINDPALIARAEIIREKGTNRSAFFRGEVDRYNWVDIGSSFLPSELISAFLWAQLQAIGPIQQRRSDVWNNYFQAFEELRVKGTVQIPKNGPYTRHNASVFYMICRSNEERDALIDQLKERGVNAVFHYLPLHKSPFFTSQGNSNVSLPNSERIAKCLIRLPLYYDLSTDQQQRVIDAVLEFYTKES